MSCRKKTGGWQSQTQFESSAEWVGIRTSAQLDSNQRVGFWRRDSPPDAPSSGGCSHSPLGSRSWSLCPAGRRPAVKVCA